MRMMTIRAAQNLQKCGFKKGDVVAIMAPDVPGLAPIGILIKFSSTNDKLSIGTIQ